MFDCVYIPTRNGRNGMLFTRNGLINIRNVKWKDDFSLLEKEGEVFPDVEYSKAYLRHLLSQKKYWQPWSPPFHILGFLHVADENCPCKNCRRIILQLEEPYGKPTDAEAVTMKVRKFFQFWFVWFENHWLLYHQKISWNFLLFLIILLISIIIVFDVSEHIDDFLKHDAPVKSHNL